MSDLAPHVRYRDPSAPVACPYSHRERIVTGGEGGVTNVRVVRVTEGKPRVHAAAKWITSSPDCGTEKMDVVAT
jgi:hypothetical protein